MITSVRWFGNKTLWMFHVGGPCWEKIWWLILRQPSPCASWATCLGYKCQETQPLPCTSHQPAWTEGSRQLQKYCFGRLKKGYSLPKRWSEAPLLMQRELLPKCNSHTVGKPHAPTCPLFSLSTFSALKSDSKKKNLLLSELLSALTYRADASIGAKDEDYPRGANFEHIRTWVAKEVPVSLHHNYITRVFSSPRFSLLMTTMMCVFLHQ